MSKNPVITDAIDRYLSEVITRETSLQRRLREETATLPQAVMLTTPDQVAFLQMVIKMIGAKRIIEIGTFTGYSALAMASALPEGGKLICCDINRDWTGIAGRYWSEAGVADKIELHIAPALQTVQQLLQSGMEGAFDMAFIDADKAGYDAYYEACLRLIRPGGVIAFDNMLWGSAVADPSEQDHQTTCLRTLNAKIRDDTRVDACLLTIADGIMLVRKR